MSEKLRECCRALDNQGHRCLRRDTIEVAYFGDTELYLDSYYASPSWVLVPLCSVHRGKDDTPHKAAGERIKE